MNDEMKFENALEIIIEGGSPFPADAYRFVRDSLRQSMKEIRRRESGEERHVSGPELLEGFRRKMLKEFGPMSRSVLENWNIASTGDVGSIVFQLIEAGTFVGSRKDTREDFEDVFDFTEAFDEPFLPESQRRRSALETEP
ncbi:MAG: Minf_1886 family protein [Verrucomicrobiota bacterium]